MPFHFYHDTIILDASCIISLYASQRFEPIIRAIPASVTVAAYVHKQEALWIYSSPDSEHQMTREPINLAPMIHAGLLSIVDIESEEEAEVVVNLSTQIKGQGEVESGAIAIVRNWALAVDDHKARRIVRETAPHIQLVHTLELVKNWAEVNSVTASEISSTLKNIRQRGSYTPRRMNPLYQWWHNHGGG